MNEQIILWIKDQLATNQLATGGLFVVVLSTLGYQLRALPARIVTGLRRAFVLEVEVRQPDRLYDWVSHWLSDLSYTKRARRLSAITDFRHMTDDDWRRLPVCLVPGIGRHWFRFEGHWIFLYRQRDEDAKGGAEGLDSLLQRESYMIYAARWSRATVHRFLQAARDKVLLQAGEGPDIFLAQPYGSWEHLRRAEPRSWKSVVLPDETKERLLERCRDFLATRDWYRDRGTPWRFGVLLHGPPGNGKTSLIQALATKLEMDLALMNLGNDTLSDEKLLQLFGCVGKRIVVLEDIDALYQQRKKKKDAGKNITFSGLLNALDGVASNEGHIIIMTTNHPERLDPALIRPGRVDLKLEIGMPQALQLETLYDLFRPGENGAGRDFAERMAGRSMAEAQSMLLEMKK